MGAYQFERKVFVPTFWHLHEPDLQPRGACIVTADKLAQAQTMMTMLEAWARGMVGRTPRVDYE